MFLSTGTTRKQPKTFEREEAMRKLPPKMHVIPGSQLEIPANIKHHFGSRLCESILSDPTKVALSARTSYSPTAAKTAPAERRGSEEPELEASYAALSDTLRSNIFPGLTTGHHRSTTHRSHNPTIYERRQPVPDAYRFQWDHVSRWNEANVLRSRLMKALEESRAEAAK